MATDYPSPAEGFLAGIDPVSGLRMSERYVINSIADRVKTKTDRQGYLGFAFKKGMGVDETTETLSREQASQQAMQTAQEIAAKAQGLDDTQFAELLKSLQEAGRMPARPEPAPLVPPSPEQVAVSTLASLVGPKGQSPDLLAMPYAMGLADQARQDKENLADWELETQFAITQAKNAGEVLDILSRRQEKEFDAQNKQVQSWRDVYNNPSASLEQRRNAWQVLREQYGEDLPQPQSKTSLEIQREASATRSLAAAKYSEVRAEDLQATRPARLAEYWSDVDLNARRGALTDSQKALVDKRVENYQEEIDIRWANVNSRYALAMAQLEALESYRAASLAQGETRIAMDYMKQMQDVVNRVNPEDQADLQEARDEVSRLDKEISEADVQLRIANTSKDKESEDAWYAAKTALIVQRRQARDAKRAIEARIAEARRDMLDRTRPLQVGQSNLSPGTPNPQAKGTMGTPGAAPSLSGGLGG